MFAKYFLTFKILNNGKRKFCRPTFELLICKKQNRSRRNEKRKTESDLNSKAVELLDQYKLNWNVSKIPLILQGSGIETNLFGIVRDTDNKVFQACTYKYNVLQNRELVEIVLRLSEKTGFDVSNGGSLFDGNKVFIQLKSNNVLNGIGNNNDTVQGFVTAINSHDGSHSLKFGNTNVTISCSNTFVSSSKDLTTKIKHTESMQQKIDSALRQIEHLDKSERLMFDSFKKLANMELKQAHLLDVVKQVTNVDLLVKDFADKHSTQSVNKANSLLGSIKSEVNQKGNSLWGLFSGVTYYTNHIVKDNSQDSIFAGKGAATNQNVFKSLLQLA